MALNAHINAILSHGNIMVGGTPADFHAIASQNRV
jgi:hypothetical protein